MFTSSPVSFLNEGVISAALWTSGVTALCFISVICKTGRKAALTFQGCYKDRTC